MRSHFFPIVMLLLACTAVSAEGQSSYPAISQMDQRERDDDRRFILESELLAERQMLAKALSMFAASPTEEGRTETHRHSENVTALLRELDDTARKRALKFKRTSVTAARPAVRASSRASRTAASFWDPYHRIAEPSDLSTPSKKETP